MGIDDVLARVSRPADTANREDKKAYAEAVAKEMALEVSRLLREKGVSECLPDPATGRGGERQIATGSGSKQVDVSLARDTTGLIFAISLKSILSPDLTRLKKTEGREFYFAKNLPNRKEEMVAEASVLHKRFPFAVLGGLFFLDRRAAEDNKYARYGNVNSTFIRAHRAFKPFTNRISHADADEKFEFFAICLCDNKPSHSLHWVGRPEEEITLDDYLDALLQRVAEVNSDYFDFKDGRFIDLRKRQLKEEFRRPRKGNEAVDEMGGTDESLDEQD
ncbi:MAG TPA: hypothetical protein VNZ52_14590 [Candidatus Thermoplasmatota archaeon]|nr:hypothetical protein [Candidatus Thermoplasmatota archaeon]